MFEKIIPKENILMHGTSARAYKDILETGRLTDMKCEQHLASVFLTNSYKIAESYAKRDVNGIILYINIKQMIKDGCNFYTSPLDNTEVIVSDDIPIKYISHVKYLNFNTYTI